MQTLNRTLFIADNPPVMRGIDSESVDLIATDPPFNKGVKAFEGITVAGDNISYKVCGPGATRSRNGGSRSKRSLGAYTRSSTRRTTRRETT